MKRLLFPLLSITALALLLGIGAVACGDDDDGGAATSTAGGNGAATSTGGGNGASTLGVYLREVNEVQEGVSEATDSIGEEVWGDPARARQALSAAIDVADSAVTALEALTPPDEAVSAHRGLISAGNNLVTVATDYYDELQGMQSGPAFDTFAEDAQATDSELSQALDEMVTACEALEEVSTENRAGVDLACPAPRS